MAKRKKKPHPFLDYALYLAMRTVVAMLHCLPLPAAMRLAAFTGDVLYLIDRRHRQRAMENLRLSFPGKPEAELRRLARDSFRMLPMVGVEVMLTPRYVKLERLAQHFVFGEQLAETMRLLILRERGVILVGGHYGNWEVLGYLMAVMGFGTTSVARPLDNPYVNEWLLGVRQRKGQRIVDKTGAMRQLPRVLREGGAAAFVADQDAGASGLFVDFFGRPASTYKSIALLAMRHRAPVAIGFSRRLRYDFRFLVEIHKFMPPEAWEGRPDPLRYITEHYTKSIEETIREEPGQYLWLHRRWKTPPP